MCNLVDEAPRIHRLGWKGILAHSVAWLYHTPDTPRIVALLFMIGLYLPGLLLSYLKFTPEGLELHYWPTYRLRAAWGEVVRIGGCRAIGIIPGEALFLDREESKMKSAGMRGWGLLKRCIIPLSDFRGWPTGALAEDLNRFLRSEVITEKRN
jgi:hypothetical protein